MNNSNFQQHYQPKLKRYSYTICWRYKLKLSSSKWTKYKYLYVSSCLTNTRGQFTLFIGGAIPFRTHQIMVISSKISSQSYKGIPIKFVGDRSCFPPEYIYKLLKINIYRYLYHFIINNGNINGGHSPPLPDPSCVLAV